MNAGNIPFDDSSWAEATWGTQPRPMEPTKLRKMYEHFNPKVRSGFSSETKKHFSQSEELYERKKKVINEIEKIQILLGNADDKSEMDYYSGDGLISEIEGLSKEAKKLRDKGLMGRALTKIRKILLEAKRLKKLKDRLDKQQKKWEREFQAKKSNFHQNLFATALFLKLAKKDKGLPPFLYQEVNSPAICSSQPFSSNLDELTPATKCSNLNE